jgi:hypothetical protein
VRVVYLHGEKPLIEERVAARKGHSTVPGVLDRHFAILEEPEVDEDSIIVDVSRPVDDIVAPRSLQKRGRKARSSIRAATPDRRKDSALAPSGAGAGRKSERRNSSGALLHGPVMADFVAEVAFGGAHFGQRAPVLAVIAGG